MQSIVVCYYKKLMERCVYMIDTVIKEVGKYASDTCKRIYRIMVQRSHYMV